MEAVLNGIDRTRAILYLRRPTRIHFQAWNIGYVWWISGLRTFAFSGAIEHAKFGPRTHQNLWIAIFQSTDQVPTHFLGVKCSIFQALSSAMKLVDLSGVCKARDHQNLGAVFGLLRAVAAFCDCCFSASGWKCNTNETRTWRSTGNDETPHQRSPPPVLCNRRKSVRSKHFKNLPNTYIFLRNSQNWCDFSKFWNALILRICFT